MFTSKLGTGKDAESMFISVVYAPMYSLSPSSLPSNMGRNPPRSFWYKTCQVCS